VAYAAGRFAFETFRGDTGRPSLLGLSEAQWLSVALVLAMLWGMGSGRLPKFFPLPALWALALLVVTASVLFAIRGRSALRRVTQVDHLAELARGIDELRAAARSDAPRDGASPPLFQSSLGICVSYGCYSENAARRLHHYALSSRQLPLSKTIVEWLASLIVRLRHAGARCELRSSSSVVHVLIPDDQTLESS
jgi:hypothetical protein